MLLICVCILCCMFLYFVWRRSTISTDEPPILPGTLPIIGHLHLAYGDSTRLAKFLQTLSIESIKAGGAIRIILGPFTFYVLTDPVEGLTAVNACPNKSRFYNIGKGLFGEGLLTANGQQWKTHRKLLNPMFTQQALNSLISVFNEQADRLVNKFDDKLGNGPFEYEHNVLVWSLESGCKTIMGINVADEKNDNGSFVEAVDSLLKLYIQRGLKLWLYSDFLYSWSSLKKEEDELLKIINNRSMQVLLKRKKILDETVDPEANILADNFRPFIDHILLLSAKEELSSEEVLDEVKTLIAGSYDTTGTTLNHVFMLLGTRVEVQNRACEELQNIFENSDRDIDKHDLMKMVYIEALIKETLRFYPTVPVYGKSVTSDIKLSKYTLRAGSEVAISAYGLCRHPMWGADADQFKPERWLDRASLPENQNLFSVFGLGKRSCIGRHYAMMSMKITLAHILRRYKITSYNNNPTFKMEVVMKPATPLLISLESRK